MSDLVQLIQDADLAIMEMETSRAAVDSAKFALEMAKDDFEKAKSAFDVVIARADELGVPRAKLKKLAEERAASLMASGLFSAPANQPRVQKVPKAKRRAAEKIDAPLQEEENVIHLDA